MKKFLQVACEYDLEGTVAKPLKSPYDLDGITTNWTKVKNTGYTQMSDRHELFQHQTGAPVASERFACP